MNWHKVTIGILATLFFFMVMGAIGTHLLLQQSPLSGGGSASFLFVAGGLVFLSVSKAERIRLLVVGGLGYISEVIGVKYGWLYGRYGYTEVLAPNVFDVPVVMICAWFILLGYVKQLLARFRVAGWLEVLLGGLWMTGIDLLIDPVAAHPFNFWKWLEGGIYYGIPGRNFLGWFGVSSLIFAIDRQIFRTQWEISVWQQIVGLSILILYTSCAFRYGYFLAGIVGILLILIQGTINAFNKFPRQTRVEITAAPL